MKKFILTCVITTGICTSTAAFATYGDLNVKSNIQETINVYCYDAGPNGAIDPNRKDFLFAPPVGAESIQTYQLVDTPELKGAVTVGCNLYVVKGSNETLVGVYGWQLYPKEKIMSEFSQGFIDTPVYKTRSHPDVFGSSPEFLLTTSYQTLKKQD